MLRLTVALLLAPATLLAQDQPPDPAPLIAAAITAALTPSPESVKHREQLRALGFVISEDSVRDTYKVSRTHYPFGPDRTPRPDAFVAGVRVALGLPASLIPPPSSANAEVAADVAARLGLETTADWDSEEKTCTPPPSLSLACRYARTDGVVAVSLPIIAGDTARVDVFTWTNNHRGRLGILRGGVAVTLVRRDGVWAAVSRRNLGSIRF